MKVEIPTRVIAALCELEFFSQSEECHRLQLTNFAAYLDFCSMGSQAEAIRHRLERTESDR